jgi:hypothetical protein
MNTEMLLSQLGQLSPVLAAYIAGAVLSIIFMSRARAACLLAAGAFFILLVNTLAGMMYHVSVITEARTEGTSLPQQSISLVFFVGRCVTAAAMLMLAVAVVIGRPRAGK